MKQVKSSNKKLIVLARWSKINTELPIFRPLILILRTELRFGYSSGSFNSNLTSIRIIYFGWRTHISISDSSFSRPFLSKFKLTQLSLMLASVLFILLVHVAVSSDKALVSYFLVSKLFKIIFLKG